MGLREEAVQRAVHSADVGASQSSPLSFLVLPGAQKSMPPPGMGGAADCFFGSSATIASVVMSRPATDAAPCNAARTTLVGSMMPFDIRLTYSPLCASKPNAY